jgi:N utilization substance protein B
MSPGRTSKPTIPARLTVEELAAAIDRTTEEVEGVLAARKEAHAPEDVVDARTAVSVAAVLGVELSVEARDLTLESLYQSEIGGGEVDEGELPARAAMLVKGVLTEKEELDHRIESASEHWSIARMPVIDRSILRLGLYELMHNTETPTAVIVSEAVRLAKTYSTERSGAFVNGVLASLARSVRG